MGSRRHQMLKGPDGHERLSASLTVCVQKEKVTLLENVHSHNNEVNINLKAISWVVHSPHVGNTMTNLRRASLDAWVCMRGACVFKSPEREQTAKGNRSPDKTAPARNPKETSADNFTVSIATVAVALCRNKHFDSPAALFRLAGHWQCNAFCRHALKRFHVMNVTFYIMAMSTDE